jgi:acyl-coenzyme A thioesterase PaaI-like protein
MSNFPSLKKMQWNIWLFGLVKIPMIAYCRPKIITWNEETVVIRIRRSRRTNNHLKSMYFGALMVGADLAAGMHAFAFTVSAKKKISLAFKSCNAQFLKRPETDVFFEANAGAIVRNMIAESENKKERVNAIVPVSIKDTHGEEVARVDMELSLRVS